MVVNSEISEKVGEYLKTHSIRIPQFYHLIKTHNLPLEVDNVSQWLDDNGFPVRGIISGVGGPFEKLSGFVDHFLQPGMVKLPTYLRDTKHTLQVIENINNQIDNGELSLEGVSLITLDIDKMYNTMTKQLARGACSTFLENIQQNHEDNSVSVSSVLNALDTCLKNNFFKFNEKIYHQKKGVGTGVKFAPPYACLGIGDFESLAFSQNNQFSDLLLLWKRFIDDVLGLFRGTEDQFNNFVSWLNSLMRGTVKFKAQISSEQVEFLDLIISKENGRLETNLFVKPTNLQLYLDFRSNHPKHCKVGIIYGQALRIIERCSSIENQNKNLDDLKQKLLDRNYPTNIICRQIDRAKRRNRKDLIFQDRNNISRNKTADKTRLIFTFNKGNPPLQKWLRDAQRLLLRNERAQRIGENMQVTYKQPKNLKSLICGVKKIRSDIFEENPGCSKCHGCHACQVLTESKTFQSTNTKKVYHIRQKMNCDSTYVIYLGTCKRCCGQYVGKTISAFKRHHSGHKQEVKNSYGGLGHHFGGERGCGYTNMSFILIEKILSESREVLAEREVFWQHQLRCYIENGENGHCFRKDI